MSKELFKLDHYMTITRQLVYLSLSFNVTNESLGDSNLNTLLNEEVGVLVLM
jgi:hypothetical protein